MDPLLAIILNDIESGIRLRLQSNNLDARHIELSDELTTLRGPAVHIAVKEGTLHRKTQTHFGCDVSVFVTVIVSNVKKDDQRRSGLYPLLFGVIGILSGHALSVPKEDEEGEEFQYEIPMKRLQPVQFRQTAETGNTLAYTVQFRTQVDVPVIDEETAGQLITLGLEYYTNIETDTVPRVEDIIEYEDEDEE